MRFNLKSVSLLSRAAAVTALTLAITTTSATAVAGPAPDLSRLVVIGDSLSAGMQNFSLFYGSALNNPSREGGQTKSYANLVHRQAVGRDLVLPAISTPGFPLPYSACWAEDSSRPVIIPPPQKDPRTPEQILGSRLNPFIPSQNLAVPGQKLHDLMYLRPSRNLPSNQEDQGVQILTNLVMGFPAYFLLNVPLSQLQALEALPVTPDTVFLWIGNNDALEAIRYANSHLLTPALQFANDFNTLMTRLAARRIPNLVVANLPDATGSAFVVPVPAALQTLGLPAETTLSQGRAPLRPPIRSHCRVWATCSNWWRPAAN